MKLIFGVQPAKPLIGFPPGKARIRMRNTEFAKVRIFHDAGVDEYTIQDGGDSWTPGHFIGCNRRKVVT